MSEGFNKCTLFGNLGRDPELRVGASGTAVLKLSVACNERRKDRDGTWKDHVEYVRVAVFGKRAEALSKFLTKGASVFVEGPIRTTSFEKDGVKHYTTEVVADNLILAGGKRRGDDAEQADPADDFSGSY
jgi:single-strand DNA-binding protein